MGKKYIYKVGVFAEPKEPKVIKAFENVNKNLQEATGRDDLKITMHMPIIGYTITLDEPMTAEKRQMVEEEIIKIGAKDTTLKLSVEIKEVT